MNLRILTALHKKGYSVFNWLFLFINGSSRYLKYHRRNIEILQTLKDSENSEGFLEFCRILRYSLDSEDFSFFGHYMIQNVVRALTFLRNSEGFLEF